jgi:hypothetical protein
MQFHMVTDKAAQGSHPPFSSIAQSSADTGGKKGGKNTDMETRNPLLQT